MTSPDRSAEAGMRRSPPWSWAGRLALAVLATVAALLAVVVAPPAPQASHETDGDLLAWVESHDAFDASAGFVDAAVADRAPVHAAVAAAGALPGEPSAGVADGTPAVGACRARALVGLPAVPAAGCELPKLAADLPEPEPPRSAAAPAGVPPRRAAVAPSDPSPPRAALEPLRRPPRA